MISQKGGEYIALQCSLTQKTYFILELSRTGSNKYVSQQPIFFNEVLTGIDINYDIVLANIFSGVRLFWGSGDVENPYPYDYKRAGSIFLHNAKGSQMWTINDRKVIFICTEDELRIYELTVTTPEIVCFSMVPIKEEYRIVFTYLCDKESLLRTYALTKISKCAQSKRGYLTRPGNTSRWASKQQFFLWPFRSCWWWPWGFCC